MTMMTMMRTMTRVPEEQIDANAEILVVIIA